MTNFAKALLLLLASISLAAGVKNLSNFEFDSYPVIVPQVKEFVPIGEDFSLPQALSISLPDFCALGLEQLQGDLAKYLPGHTLERSDGENAAVELVIRDQEVPASTEGYFLRIDSKGVKIASKSSAGLFYGIQTLRAIIRNSSPDIWRGCEIRDEPTFPIRCVAYYNLRVMESEHIPHFKDAVDLLSSLKFNFLFLEFADNFPMQDSPFTLRKNTLTKAEFEDIISYAKSHHMEIIPAVQAISHVRWLNSHPAYKTEILENPENLAWNNSYCLSKPLAGELTIRLIREQLAFFKPRFYSPYLDEIASSGMPSCPDCRKQDPVKLVGEHIRAIEKVIFDGGAIPLIDHDAFYPGRDGGYGAEILETLNPATLLKIWDYNIKPNEVEFEHFARKKFPLLGSSWCAYTENNQAIPLLVKKYGGIGCVLYNGGWIYRFYTQPERISANVYASTVLAANYYWNPDGGGIRSLSWDPGYEFRLRYPKMPPSERRKGVHAIPLPIEQAMNTRLGDDEEFPVFRNSRTPDRVKAALAEAPEKFQLLTGPEGAYYGIALSASPEDGYPSEKVMIPMNFNARKLSCLLMTSRPNSMTFFVNRANFFPLVAELRLNYADGTEQLLPLKYRWNLNHWNADCSGYATRYVLSGADDRNALFYLFSADWDNLPDKRVVSMEFSAPGNPHGVVPVLLAASVFDGENRAEAKPLKSEIPRKKLIEDKKKDFILADFQDGLGKALVSFEGEFSVPVKFRAEEGELRFEIPPKLADEVQTRVIVDILFEKRTDLKSMIFAMSCDRPEQVLRSGVYVGTKDFQKHRYRFRVEDTTLRERQEVRVPFSSMRGATNVAPDEFSKLRVSFWLNNQHPMTLCLDDIGVSEKEVFDRTALRSAE